MPTSNPAPTARDEIATVDRRSGILLMVLGALFISSILVTTYGTDLLSMQRRAAAEVELQHADVAHTLAATRTPLLAAYSPADEAEAAPAGSDQPSGSTGADTEAGQATADDTQPNTAAPAPSGQVASTFDDDDPTMMLDDTASGNAPADTGVREGQAIASVSFPSLGEDMPIVHDATPAALTVGPGWIPGSAELGSAGNAVISGHRTTYGSPFRRLGELSRGDRIVVDKGRERLVYEVRDMFITTPQDTRLTGHTSGARLTLTTCHPIGSARERLIIQAELVEGGDAGAAVHGDDWSVYRSETTRPV